MEKKELLMRLRYKNISRILITGGLGFIGSALIRNLLANTSVKIFNFDKKTYASNEASINFLFDGEKCEKISRYFLIEGDLANQESVRNAIDRARMRQANRMFNSGERVLTKADLVTIESEDFRKSRLF